MRHLADTNLYLRVTDPTSAQHATAKRAINRLLGSGHEICVTTQNVVEFWAVATRPVAANGLGLSPTDAAIEVRDLLAQYSILDDTPAIRDHWLKLVTGVPVTGKRAHDARLAAVMLAHGVTHLLTFNGNDFKDFPGITIVDPASV